MIKRAVMGGAAYSLTLLNRCVMIMSGRVCAQPLTCGQRETKFSGAA